MSEHRQLDQTGHAAAMAAAPEHQDRDDSPNGDEDGEYGDLEPLLAEYARLTGDDPGRARLRERLVTGFLPLANHLARRYSQRGVPTEDLVQVAALGLVQAIDRYDPSLGHNFLAFAIPTMQGEVRRYFRDRTWSMRVPRRLRELHIQIGNVTRDLSQQLGRAPRPSEIAAHLGISTDEVLEGLEAGTAYSASSLDRELDAAESEGSTLAQRLGENDPQLELVEIHHTLQPILATLPARERTILLMRFFGNMTQTQIAEKIGISQMHVSRLLAKTLAELRERLDPA
jgi:RNA polymerase sigma-B factor